MSQFYKTKEETKEWLDDMEIKNYKINDDLTVDVSGNVDISSKYLRNIPVKFGKVNGNFYCYGNFLKTLEGSPNYVGNDFYCHSNKLKSLEGAPNYVGLVFNAMFNKDLSSIKDLPDCKDVYIFGNENYSNLSNKEEIFKQRNLEKAEYENSIINTSINEVSQKSKPKIKFKI